MATTPDPTDLQERLEYVRTARASLRSGRGLPPDARSIRVRRLVLWMKIATLILGLGILWLF